MNLPVYSDSALFDSEQTPALTDGRTRKQGIIMNLLMCLGICLKFLILTARKRSKLEAQDIGCAFGRTP